MSSSEAVLIDVLHYLFINIILLGFVGNFLSFKIYSTIALRKHTISIYFRVIAIVDSIMLLSGFLYFLEQKYDFNLSRLNQFLCKFRNYTFDAIGPVSPWLMVVVSFDRFISIGFPRRFPIFFKFYFQVTVICVIFVFNIAFYTPMIWTSSLVEGMYLKKYPQLFYGYISKLKSNILKFNLAQKMTQTLAKLKSSVSKNTPTVKYNGWTFSTRL